MVTRTPPPDPSNRLPWIALGLAVLLILIGVGVFLANRQRDTTITIQGTPTANAVARAGTPGAPPTLAVPTLPPSQPSTTPLPTVTPVPVATKPPGATPGPAATAAAPAATPAQAAPAATPEQAAPPATPEQAAPAATPAQAAPVQPTPPPAADTPAPATAAPVTATPVVVPTSPPPSPTPFAGQVANAGGLGNTRSDLDSAFGAPVGETPQHLVVYRKNNFEYHVQFVPDPNGRADVIVEMTPTPMALDAATNEARKLLPKDAQPPSPAPEGNDQFVVQRFTSQTLAQALGPDAFAKVNAQPGQFMVVYVRDQNGRITRSVVGIGNDPNTLLGRGQ